MAELRDGFRGQPETAAQVAIERPVDLVHFREARVEVLGTHSQERLEERTIDERARAAERLLVRSLQGIVAEEVVALDGRGGALRRA